MRSFCAKVPFHVAAYQLYGFLAHIHRMYQFCSSSQRIHRESSCIAEHVQHLFAVGVMLQQRAVVALVNKETRLLTAKPIYSKVQPILFCPKIFVCLCGFSYQIAHSFACYRGFVWQGIVGFVIYFAYLRHYFCYSFCYLFSRAMHAYGVGLYYGCVGIYIHYQSWQKIPFAVYQSIAVVGCAYQS